MSPEENFKKELNDSINAGLASRPEEYWLGQKKSLKSARSAIDAAVGAGFAQLAFKRLKDGPIGINSETSAFVAGIAYATDVLRSVEKGLEERGY